MMIQVGAEAPDFELPSNELGPDGKPGKPVKLSDFRDKRNVVLAFYPLDFSPVCTTEHGCLREDLKALEAAGAQVLGISVDSKWAHHAYAKQMGISYPLLSDFHPKGAVAEKYGLYLANAGITARATVIVDKKGTVAWVKEQALTEPRDDKLILEQLKKLS
jgi:peroxiredoxin